MNKYRHRVKQKVEQKPSLVVIETFKNDVANGKINLQFVEKMRNTLNIPVEIYLGFLQGTETLEQKTIQLLEKELKLMQLESKSEASKKPRGGLRIRAGRKPEGNVSKLVRITALPLEMKQIERWIRQSPRASKQLANLILRDITKNSI